MAKINYNNAKAEITAMIENAGFEKKICVDGNSRYSYYEMTEDEYSDMLAQILERSTKAFKTQLERYSDKDSYGEATIQTLYNYYAVIKIVEKKEPVAQEEPTAQEEPAAKIKLKDLKPILYSTRGYVQYAIVFDSKTSTDLENGCTIDYAVKTYGEKEVIRIEAFENNLLITV